MKSSSSSPSGTPRSPRLSERIAAIRSGVKSAGTSPVTPRAFGSPQRYGSPQLTSGITSRSDFQLGQQTSGITSRSDLQSKLDALIVETNDLRSFEEDRRRNDAEVQLSLSKVEEVVRAIGDSVGPIEGLQTIIVKIKDIDSQVQSLKLEDLPRRVQMLEEAQSGLRNEFLIGGRSTPARASSPPQIGIQRSVTQNQSVYSSVNRIRSVSPLRHLQLIQLLNMIDRFLHHREHLFLEFLFRLQFLHRSVVSHQLLPDCRLPLLGILNIFHHSEDNQILRRIVSMYSILRLQCFREKVLF